MKTNLLKQALMLSVLFVTVMSSSNVEIIKTANNRSKVSTSAKNETYSIGTDLKPESKSFRFEHMASGDCEMAAGGTLTIYSDGHAEFRATVWTNHTHSGDTWHHHIYFRNNRNQTIFEINLDGPNHMNDGGPRYAFNSNFSFPAGLFYAVNTVTVQGRC